VLWDLSVCVAVCSSVLRSSSLAGFESSIDRMCQNVFSHANSMIRAFTGFESSMPTISWTLARTHTNSHELMDLSMAVLSNNVNLVLTKYTRMCSRKRTRRFERDCLSQDLNLEFCVVHNQSQSQ